MNRGSSGLLASKVLFGFLQFKTAEGLSPPRSPRTSISSGSGSPNSATGRLTGSSRRNTNPPSVSAGRAPQLEDFLYGHPGAIVLSHLMLSRQVRNISVDL